MLLARVTAKAEAMGLLAKGTFLQLDRPSLEQLFEACRRAGVGGSATALIDDPAALLTLLDEALEASPCPDPEWVTVVDVLGQELVTKLVGLSESSLRRYTSGQRHTPDEIAVRLHALALIIGDLAGSYNDYGIRRWFLRKRQALGGHSPMEVLEGSWSPDETGPAAVRSLSSALLGSPAT
jgi:hypothetical protein